MTCMQCPKKAVITVQHGSYCKNHFVEYFEERVFKTINKFNLLSRKDIICVAASGGKDSLTVLYLTQKYLAKNQISAPLFALAVDEGIQNYREKTLEDLKTFCTTHTIQIGRASCRER